MFRSTPSLVRGAAKACAFVLASSVLGGCAVITVAGAAVGVAATVAGLAVDAAAGTVRLTGKAIGAAADAVAPDGED